MSRKRNRKAKKQQSLVQKQVGFGASLEQYVYKRIAESRVRWGWVGMVIVILIVVISIAGGYFKSFPLFGSLTEVIKMAVEKGDYGLADTLYRQYQVASIEYQVLGTESQLEELVYPERKIEHEIQRQEELLAKYPGSRDILVALARLYSEIGQEERAQGYWEQARVLDPNNEIFK